jgi:hypothetical protein
LSTAKPHFTISGGSDAIAEQKEVQASLTGASNVTLKVGDTKVAFDNGVTVKFDALTAEDLDTMASKSEFSVTAGATNTIAGTASSYALSASHTTAPLTQVLIRSRLPPLTLLTALVQMPMIRHYLRL